MNELIKKRHWYQLILSSIWFFCVDISEINYPTYGLSTISNKFSILNYQQNHRLWRKKDKSWYNIIYKILNYLQNHCGENMVKSWYYIIKKIIEGSSLASQGAMFTSETGLPAHRCCAIQHKSDILPIQTCSNFFCVD